MGRGSIIGVGLVRYLIHPLLWEDELNNFLFGNWQMPVLEDLNDRAISLEEVREAVNEMRPYSMRQLLK